MCGLVLPARTVPQSRRASTLSGVGARHRLRGGSGRSNVLGLIDGALLHDLRVSDSQCTSARDPSHHPAACVSRPDAAHLQWSGRAEDSKLRLRSRPYYHVLPRRLRKRCEKSFYRAKLSHFRDVPHRGARRGRVRPSPATQSAALAAGAAGPRPGLYAHIPPAPALAVGRPSGGPGASGMLYAGK